MIATKNVIEHFGGAADVAAFFGIKVQAVYQWGLHVPQLREAQLQLRLPHVFGSRKAAPDNVTHAGNRPRARRIG